MKLAIDIPDDLVRAAEQRASASGRTLGEVITEALLAHFERSDQVALPVFGGGKLLPGVDLDDSAALLDRMEPT
jgi:hypothetical protein